MEVEINPDRCQEKASEASREAWMERRIPCPAFLY